MYMFQEGMDDPLLRLEHIEAVLANYRPSLQQHHLHTYMVVQINMLYNFFKKSFKNTHSVIIFYFFPFVTR